MASPMVASTPRVTPTVAVPSAMARPVRVTTTRKNASRRPTPRVQKLKMAILDLNGPTIWRIACQFVNEGGLDLESFTDSKQYCLTSDCFIASIERGF